MPLRLCSKQAILESNVHISSTAVNEKHLHFDFKTEY